MTALPKTLAALALCGLMQAPTPAVWAQSPPVLSVQSEIDAFTTRLQSYVDFCQTYAKPQYRVDCLSERLDFAAASLNGYGWQRDVRAALRATSRSLYAVTTKYGAANAPAVTLRGQTTPITSARPIRPVAPQNQTRANAAATGVIQEAELVLLRSAETSPANALAFAQVAAVLGSAKVLLRSA